MSDANLTSHHHDTEPDYGTGKKTFKMYVTGVLLCIVLTLIPFGVVMHGAMSRGAMFAVLFVSAIAQFFVQVVCFLRLNAGTEQSKMNLMSFIFAIVILAVIVGGSLWIMYHLNYNMMH